MRPVSLSVAISGSSSLALASALFLTDGRSAEWTTFPALALSFAFIFSIMVLLNGLAIRPRPSVRAFSGGPGGRGGRQMMAVFACAAAVNRSPTAAELFDGWIDRRGRRWTASSCGSDGPTPEETERVAEADVIIAMEKIHVDNLRYRVGRKRPPTSPMHCLDIPDRYLRGDPELVKMLMRTVPPILDSTEEGHQ